MFEKLTPAPPDSILGLTDAFRKDPNPHKINLGVGVYKDAHGNTPILNSVRQAEERILAAQASKSYLPIEGSPTYAAITQQLIFGSDHPVIAQGRAATAQTPGGTGALRVAADFLASTLPGRTVWLSEPTWPNHPSIFEAAGLKTAGYPYFDKAAHGVDFAGLLAAVRAIPEGDVVLLHACCHNPTGVDLTAAQWRQLAAVIAERNLLPLIDFAYQGFANGLVEDAEGVKIVAELGREFLVANSYSKNLGLYNERVGALTVVGATADAAQTAMTHVKRTIRANYSNPPAHGGAVVALVLGDPDLRAEWEAEVSEMRNRINGMRHLFVETLNEKGVDRDFSFIARQRGMFSFSGLTLEHVNALRERYAIYIVGSGRINVAGMTEGNMDYLCSAIAEVVGG